MEYQVINKNCGFVKASYKTREKAEDFIKKIIMNEGYLSAAKYEIKKETGGTKR